VDAVERRCSTHVAVAHSNHSAATYLFGSGFISSQNYPARYRSLSASVSLYFTASFLPHDAYATRMHSAVYAVARECKILSKYVNVDMYSALSWFVSKTPGMAHVSERSQSFTCHPHVYPQVKWAILHAFTSQPRFSPHNPCACSTLCYNGIPISPKYGYFRLEIYAKL